LDFFAQQDLARRNARVLVVLFIIAVIALLLLTNALVAAVFWVGEDYNLYAGQRRDFATYVAQFDWERIALVSSFVLGTIGLVSFLKWRQLARGGSVIAEAVGAERVLPQTEDPDERRLRNVVQEVALAANMPVPDVYLLRNERGINAFAAGSSPANAVVAVTSGTLHHLNRSELQAVIGHEFSHILNGDMRLNIQLTAMLKGITFIGDVGYFLIRTGARPAARRGTRDGRAALPTLGLGLLLIGWLGALCAGLIKAAISRQKEYLADAAAVQFTRDAGSVRNALRVIGGYRPGTLVQTAAAADMSHMFFAAVTHRLWQTFATHPPLEQRIRRLDPRWDGSFIERPLRHYPNTRVRADRLDIDPRHTTLIAAAIAATQSGGDSETYTDLPVMPDTPAAQALPGSGQTGLGTDQAGGSTPSGLLRHTEEPLGASTLCLALLLAADAPQREQQLALVARHGARGQPALLQDLWPQVQALSPAQRLPLLERCLPALRSMSLEQYRSLKDLLLMLINADGRTELFEWCLFQLVRHYLDPHFVSQPSSKPRYSHLSKVDRHLRVVLSMLAHEGSGDASEAFRLAADALEFKHMQLMPCEQLSVSGFGQSVQTLADCYPLLKPRILKAMLLAASADGGVCEREREIIYAVAAVIDCPLPAGIPQPPY
jgi:Zn-dependent protease with chaperone function